MVAVRWIALAAVLALSASLLACGGGSASAVPGSVNPAVQTGSADKLEDVDAMLPGLPNPGELARTLSDAAYSELDGAQFAGAWPHNNLSDPDGVTGRFNANWINASSPSDNLAYGLYQFSLTGHDGSVLPLEMDWSSVPPPGSLYAGLANFALGRWDWSAFDPAGSLDISDFTSYTSSDQLVVCVMVAGFGSGDLRSLNVGTNPGSNDPPVAILLTTGSFIQPGGQASFDASGSYDPDGAIEQYDWDLDGDGSFEMVDGPSAADHTFLSLGTYDAAVRVTDNRGEQSVRHATVVVYDAGAQFDETETNDAEDVANWVPLADKLPATDFTGWRGSLGQGGYDGGREDYYLIRVPKAGRLTLEMFFTDDDADLDMRLLKLNADGTTTTTIASATSTSDNETIEWNFTEPGAYYWYCFVYSSAPADAVSDYTLAAAFATSEPPQADLQASPTSGDWPLAVDFDASASFDPDGTIEKYDYDFDGNGTFESLDAGPTPTHEYTSQAGEINATVRVTDDFGLTDTASIMITVINDEPIPAFSMDVSSGDRPLTVNFDAMGSSDPDGTIKKYEWDFNGDGTWDLSKTDTATDPTLATGVYYALGTFDATLRVTDDTGQTQTVSHQVTVTGGADMETEPNNDNDTTNTAADAAAANSLPGFFFNNYFGQVGPKADPEGDPGDPDDWFVFTVASTGEVDLVLDIFDAVCDIDMKLYAEDDYSTTVGSSTGTDDDEQITETLNPGTYYLRIYAYTGRPAWGGYRLGGSFTP